MSKFLIEVRSFSAFWQDCGSDPHNSYKDKHGTWRCRKMGRICCNANNCPDYKEHIEDAQRAFDTAIEASKDNRGPRG